MLASASFALGAASEHLLVEELCVALEALRVGCDVLRARIRSHTETNGAVAAAASAAVPERSVAVRQCVENETDATLTVLRQALGYIAGAAGRIGRVLHVLT